MSSHASNSSWHPAFMPNSAADLEKPIAETTAIAPDAVTHEADTITHLLEPTDVAQQDDPGVDEWFPEYESGSPRPEEPAYAPIIAADSHPEVDDVAPSNDDQEEPDDETPMSSQAAKHASTISFARTVAHEVNWDGDDEDPEWDLPRTDTDPFKFMGPSDRTNSFPAVPTLHQPSHHSDEVPLASSQAEEVMREVDQEEEGDSWDPEMTSAGAQEMSHYGHANEQGQEDTSFSHQVGGDLLGPSEDASDERYAEGIPLISHDSNLDQLDTVARDPFAEGNGDDDDFFTQVEGHGDPAMQDASFEAPTLERKSTTQIINALTSTSPGLAATALEEADEDEEPVEGQVATSMDNASQEVPDPSVDAGNGAAPKAVKGGDLAAEWAGVFDDEDDFLLEDSTGEPKEVDAAGFLGDDDEGFLDDSAEPETSAPFQPTSQPRYQPSAAAAAPPQTPSNPYLPTGGAPPPLAHQTSSYFPRTAATPLLPPAPTSFGAPPSAPPVTGLGYGMPPPSRPEAIKIASFADKSKGGYQSPYDLPMEVMKPRKRQSMQQLPRNIPTPSAPPVALPPRSVSQVVSPTRASVSSLTPPTSSQSAQFPPGAGKPPQTQLKRSKESFFEDLPISPNKPRSASRQSHKSQPSPSQTSPYAMSHPPPVGPPQLSPLGFQAQPTSAPTQQPSQGQPSPPQTAGADINSLVAPPRVSPYAPLQPNGASQHSPPAPGPPSAKYSPAPAHLPTPNGPPPAAPPNKYSSAPSLGRSTSGGYAPAPAGVPPPVLPHQPRTSSPLAHFEVSHDRGKHGLANQGESHLHERRSASSLYEPRLNRMPSLPPTKEVAEEDAPPQARHSLPPVVTTQTGYSAQRPRQTPPPPSYQPQSTLSPPKRTSAYGPSQHQAAVPQSRDFIPPQRSMTQSPGSLYGRGSADPIPRPSSVHDPTSPRTAAPPIPSISAAPPVSGHRSRSRTWSQNLSLVPPTDGTEQDPLKRWKGSPIISWGVGGTFVTSFPKNVPRYGTQQAMPRMIRSPGEVKVKNIKELQPLEERLAKFPGPLKGKSKKKETLAWMSTGIDTLERSLPTATFHSYVSHEDKRAVERVLLWKILRLFVEHDGALEGNAAVDKAVREVLSPNSGIQTTEASSAYATNGGFQGSAATSMQSDAVDASTLERIRNSLLVGDREKAVWDAADKRLWGHALIIASTASPELYRKVTQEFVRKEVNVPGHNNESLAALYDVLSGNHQECVDELVPVHARAGLQLMQTNSASGPSKDSLAGLDKWQETLGLILSNRSTDDIRAINALGDLLSGYGRAEAAHICFLFARNATVFGGLDDPKSNFVLVGADHRRQADQFAKETEALLLSEVYEYGLSLNGANSAGSSAHLAAYKLQHAMTLAEYGYRDKALQYCEAIGSAIISQTRRSPYHHAILETAVEDLMKRLRQAPKEESNSWIPKPSMNKMSDSMWNRFNKFVAGDDADGSGPGSDGDGGAESGPFARMATTPTISRPPSTTGTTGMEMFSPQSQQQQQPVGYPMANGPVASAPVTRAASRYAPASASAATPSPYEPTSAYTPPARVSMERSSGEYGRSSQEVPRRSLDQAAAPSPSYMPDQPTHSPSYPSSGLSISRESSYMPTPPPEATIQTQSKPSPNAYHPYSQPDVSTNGSAYAPQAPTPSIQDEKPAETGYQPSGHGYEPPSMSTPFEAPSAETTQPTDDAPSYQPYSYEPPSYNNEPEPSAEDGNEPKPKKKSFMDDDEDDIPSIPKPAEKSKVDRDRENAEMFRKAAEEDAKRAEADKAAKGNKKGWGLGSWWGGGAKPSKDALEPNSNKPVRAKLGEKNSFYFDPEIKRWVNKNATPDENATSKKATPPPPRSAPRSASGTPPPPASGSMLPPAPPRGVLNALNPSPSVPNLAAAAAAHGAGGALGAPPAMMRSASNTSAGSGGGPPSRPATSMSNASSIDDLLSAAGPRKGAKKPRKSGRYVDVMAK